MASTKLNWTIQGPAGTRSSLRLRYYLRAFLEGANRIPKAQRSSARMAAKLRMTNRQFNSFADFWPYYLGEHSQPATRVLHCLGTLTALSFGILLIAMGRWWLFPLALIPGYAFAWAAHFFIEKNRPATFTHPLWSFMGDLKMLALMLTGRLRP